LVLDSIFLIVFSERFVVQADADLERRNKPKLVILGTGWGAIALVSSSLHLFMLSFFAF
jgi:hypothetical protein